MILVKLASLFVMCRKEIGQWYKLPVNVQSM